MPPESVRDTPSESKLCATAIGRCRPPPARFGEVPCRQCFAPHPLNGRRDTRLPHFRPTVPRTRAFEGNDEARNPNDESMTFDQARKRGDLRPLVRSPVPFATEILEGKWIDPAPSCAKLARTARFAYNQPFSAALA